MKLLLFLVAIHVGNGFQSQLYVSTQIHHLFSTLSDDSELVDSYGAELFVDDDDDDDDENDWRPDRELALQRRVLSQKYMNLSPPDRFQKVPPVEKSLLSQELESKPQSLSQNLYSEEEEELIHAMGGTARGKREPGYLGDCTLAEISRDYSVPVCYLADVLCKWGVPVPINIHDRLGDMVTGEQAFAILEAIHTLDIAALHDRYSNYNILELCDFYDLNLRDAFQMAINEGWSLPFGVRTCLRVEQEQELLRVLEGSYLIPETEDEF
jgi:hypothetical protein